MIPKPSKFPLRTELLTFRAKSVRSTTPHFQLLFHSRSAGNITLRECDTRLAVVVPKKLSKLATTRNWLKRLTYDTLWGQLKDKNLDVVVMYKPLVLKRSIITGQQITHELLQAATTI